MKIATSSGMAVQLEVDRLTADREAGDAHGVEVRRQDGMVEAGLLLHCVAPTE